MDWHAIFLVVGRLLVGGVFVWAGIDHFRHFDPPLGIIRRRGVPYAAAALTAASIWELALGALLVAGLWIVPVALGLAVFTIAATVIMHNFWSFSGKERVDHTHATLANIMVVGGLLVLASTAL